MNIAIYGGSFNPPHMGHYLTIASLLARPDIDRVWMVPVAKHAHGKELADFDQRINLCEELTNYFDLLAVRVLDHELRNETGESINLLRMIEKDCDKLVASFDPDMSGQMHNIRFVVGSDILDHFHTWRGYEEILSKYSPIVMMREGSVIKGPIDDRIDVNPYVVMPCISSTQVRELLKNGNHEAAAKLLPAGVLGYILGHNSWQNDKLYIE